MIANILKSLLPTYISVNTFLCYALYCWL